MTGVMVAGLGVSFAQFSKYSGRQAAASLATEADIRDHQVQSAKMKEWNHRTLEFAAAAVVSGAVTAFLWGRSQTRESFSVQPTRNGGATVSWGRSF